MLENKQKTQFWMGVILIVLGNIIAFLKFNLVIYIFMTLGGLFIVYKSKYRFMKKIVRI
jgi:hypothetical protein